MRTRNIQEEMRTPWSQKNNIIWPSFNRQFNTAVSGDNTVHKAVPYLDRYQQEQLERQQERQKRWEKTDSQTCSTEGI